MISKMKKILKRTLGLILLPFIYARYSALFFIPLLFHYGFRGDLIGVWFFYLVIFGFIMGNCGFLEIATKILQYFLKIKYEVTGQWTSNMAHSYSYWQHPTIKVNDKEYNLSIAIAGGNLYDYEDAVRRKAIWFWIMG